MGHSEEEIILEDRKRKTLDFLKVKYNWLIYVLLAILVWFAYWIRTLNLSGLRDISTGGWALGPDLDPWLFTRWAGYIVTHGSLMVVDTMRAVPLGLDTKGELLLLPYMIAWFHKIAVLFGSTSVVQSADIFPAVMFALTVISFFLLSREIFIDSIGLKKSNIIALISSFFLIILPPLLPRTIAGIPEKESTGFFFMFLALYFFLLAWKSKGTMKTVILSLLTGASTAAMTLIWGGVAYVYFTIGIAIVIAFFLNQFDRNKIFIPIIWLFSSYLMVAPFTERFTALHFFTGTSSLLTIIPILSFFVYAYINKKKINFIENNKYLSRMPKTLLAFIIVLILGFIISLILFGTPFINFQFHQIVDNLVTPITSRLGVTVAENRQPFFDEWANTFGPLVYGIPIFFWLFFIGSIFIVSLLLRNFDKKERRIMITSYVLFLFALVFSRYKSDSFLNGTNTISLTIYALGFIVLSALAYPSLESKGMAKIYLYNVAIVAILIIIYFMLTNNIILVSLLGISLLSLGIISGIGVCSREEYKSLDFGIILLLAFFLLSIVSARGAVRLIMVLVPPTAIIVGYLIVKSFYNASENRNSSKATISLVLAIIVILSSIYSAYYLYKETHDTSQSYAPNAYNQQWQLAMSWVRDNTSENAVFAHWWDYGYWLQSIGNRATVLDGGNAITYWNYLMGRYALTGTSNDEALEFLYSHNVTHFLIDSTDIGKYGAFSSIGSDKNYDRRSYIPTIGKDATQKQETKNGTIYIYNAGIGLDGDLIYEQNGSKIFLPEGRAGLGAITIELDKTGKILSQPHAVFVYQNKQYNLPLRYAYKDSLIDYKTGIEAGIFLLPVFNGQNFDETGAAFYLSPKTVNSQLARLYLYKEDNGFFRLAHSEDDFLVRDLKKAGLTKNDFVVAGGGLRGPIKIWEVSYPSNIKLNPAYLNTSYPSHDIEFA